MSKSYKPRPYGTLCGASDALVAAAGGATAAAAFCRATDKSLGRYTDPDIPETSMPVDVVADIEAAVGQPIVSRWMVERLGCQVLPALPDAAPTQLVCQIAEAGQWTSKLFGDFTAALTDERTPGEVDDGEARDLLEDVDKLIAVLMAGKCLLLEQLGERPALQIGSEV